MIRHTRIICHFEVLWSLCPWRFTCSGLLTFPLAPFTFLFTSDSPVGFCFECSSICRVSAISRRQMHWVLVLCIYLLERTYSGGLICHKFEINVSHRLTTWSKQPFFQLICHKFYLNLTICTCAYIHLGLNWLDKNDTR